jgi:hypothetical protein
MLFSLGAAPSLMLPHYEVHTLARPLATVTYSLARV